jgi:hypothetical protein
VAAIFSTFHIEKPKYLMLIKVTNADQALVLPHRIDIKTYCIYLERTFLPEDLPHQFKAH